MDQSLIAQLMGPTWGPSGADRTQVGPMLAPSTMCYPGHLTLLEYCPLWCTIWTYLKFTGDSPHKGPVIQKAFTYHNLSIWLRNLLLDMEAFCIIQYGVALGQIRLHKSVIYVKWLLNLIVFSFILIIPIDIQKLKNCTLCLYVCLLCYTLDQRSWSWVYWNHLVRPSVPLTACPAAQQLGSHLRPLATDSPHWCLYDTTIQFYYCILSNENFCIVIQVSLKFSCKCPADSDSVLVQFMAWCWTGGKPLPEPVMTKLYNAIYFQCLFSGCLKCNMNISWVPDLARA